MKEFGRLGLLRLGNFHRLEMVFLLFDNFLWVCVYFFALMILYRICGYKILVFGNVQKRSETFAFWI